MARVGAVVGGLWGTQTRSCSSPVLVQQTAEQVVSMHLVLVLLADHR